MKDISQELELMHWKTISLDQLPQVVEDWVMMTPPQLTWWSQVRLLQRVTAFFSISTVLSVLHVVELPRQPQKCFFLWSNQNKERERHAEARAEATKQESDEVPCNMRLASTVWWRNGKIVKSSSQSRKKSGVSLTGGVRV